LKLFGKPKSTIVAGDLSTSLPTFDIISLVLNFRWKGYTIHTATLDSWFGCYSHVQLWFVCPIVPLSNRKCMYQVSLPCEIQHKMFWGVIQCWAVLWIFKEPPVRVLQI
jgi:hypothetical protein